jgi:hypothetical protein
MKTAVKPILWAGAASLLLALPSWAETTVLDLANQQNAERAAVTAQAQPAGTAAPAVAAPVINSPALNTASATPIVAPVPVPLAVPSPMNGNEAKGQNLVTLDSPTGTASDKDVPPQVQAVADKLRGAKVDLSLEDMNQARAALARLDLLLELEQKMHDLQEARQKNSGSSGGADISGYLPPQVAGMGKRPPPPVPAVLTESDSAAPAPTTTRRSKPKPAPSQYEVQRVMGVNGNYSAVLKSVADIKTKTVKVGDMLSDGSEVAGISPTAVTLRDPDTGKTERIIIENVSALSGGRGAH